MTLSHARACHKAVFDDACYVMQDMDAKLRGQIATMSSEIKALTAARDQALGDSATLRSHNASKNETIGML